MRPSRPILVVLLAAAAVSGCSISTTSSSTTTSAPVAPLTSQSPEPVLDLQLRQVEGAERAEPGSCATLPARTPGPSGAATLCSNDGKVSYSLAPAAVSGQSVTSIEVLQSSQGPVVQIKLDAMGGAALRTTTLRGSLADPQPRLAIVTHGGVLAAPTMTAELDGGVLLVSGFESREKAQQVVDYITATDPDPAP
jgi:preprotein translocase subunit SecD